MATWIERRKDYHGQRLGGVQHPDVFKKLLKIFLEHNRRNQECPEVETTRAVSWMPTKALTSPCRPDYPQLSHPLRGL